MLCGTKQIYHRGDDVCFICRAETPGLASATPSPFRADNRRKKNCRVGRRKAMKHARTVTLGKFWKQVRVFLMKTVLETASLIKALETIWAFLKKVL
jgi:hypothetical protein